MHILNSVYLIRAYQIILMMLSFPVLPAFTQKPWYQDLVLKSWDHSAFLKEKEFRLLQAEASLKEARSLYLPTLSWLNQYSLAAGGRSIDLPIGDLINPIHRELNRINGNNQFPVLPNVQTYFLPNNFLDSRLRFQQAVYEPDINILKSVRKEEARVQSLDIQAFKRNLSREVIETALALASAQEWISIIQRGRQYLLTAKRQTESLFRNGMAAPSALHRLDVELLQLDSRENEAITLRKQAVTYLSYLTGSDSISPPELEELPSLSLLSSGTREELLMLESGLKIQQQLLKKEQQFYHPRLGMQADLGSQDFNFNWNPYVLLGFQFEIPLYNGRKNTHRKVQAEQAIRATEAKINAVNEQLQLQRSLIDQQYHSALDQATIRLSKLDLVEKIWKEALRKYSEGISNYLELLDAQNLWYNSQSDYRIARFEAWKKWSEYYYATASYPITE